jgi:hypothetical protein
MNERRNNQEKANWLQKQLHQLKTEGATPVLTTLLQIASQHAEHRVDQCTGLSGEA